MRHLFLCTQCLNGNNKVDIFIRSSRDRQLVKEIVDQEEVPSAVADQEEVLSEAVVVEVVAVALQEEVTTISSAEFRVVSPRMAVVEAAAEEEEVETAHRQCKLKVRLPIQNSVLNKCYRAVETKYRN